LACIRLPRVSLRTLGRHRFGRFTQFIVPWRHHCNLRLRFGVIRCATAWLDRINRPAPSTTSATRWSCCTTGPTTAGSTCRHPSRACLRKHALPRNAGRSASLEVFVPCNAHWLRSRCPGRPASGRSRFGVCIAGQPARVLSMRPVDAMSFVRPCGFPLISGFIAMKLVQRTRLTGAFQSNPSLARRLGPNGPNCVRVGG